MKSLRTFPFAKLGRPLSLVLALVALTAAGLWGCRSQTSPGLVVKPPNNMTVRGYLAVVVGGSGTAEKMGIFARGMPQKEIFIPGVEVHLNDPQSGKTSDPIKTDLSGRFTLSAPAKGKYQLCWKSKVYDPGCTQTFIDVDGRPQFLSTVYMTVPRKPDYVAITGNVRNADGDSVRTFDPYFNINAFATVALNDAQGSTLSDVYVNNFGDYLLPYVPVKQKINLAARIEAAKYDQEIRPEAELEKSALSQVNLKFANRRPRLEPLVALDQINNRRVQNTVPGSKVNLKARARDKDGDPVNFSWFLGEGSGQLSQTTGANVEWTLPPVAGRFSVTVVAHDDKGGYDRAVLSLLADGSDVPFGGIVVDPAGAPIAGTAVEIVGNPPLLTDANGRFQTRVKAADRYVFNARKQGYALNSRIYDNAVAGGRWILYPAQLITIDPTQDVSISHRRTKRDCPGPDSAVAGLGAAGDSLLKPQWQDGEGNIIDAPSALTSVNSLAQLGKLNVRTKRERPIFFPPRGLKLGECGPGFAVDIPANSILDASGNPATAPLQVGIATVDLFSPQQMPGDDGVVPLSGGGAYVQSFGAGSLDLPTGFKLKPGASAQVTIPVDRARRGGAALPATVPLLSYDEKQGLWVEEDKLTLSGTAYVGKVKHFTSYNADTFFNNAACLRVFSPSLPGQYNLEVMSPYPDGTPHYKNYPIDNVSATEHVIYNITPNANMTLAPMTSGANPQLLGFYVVNSGPPQNPSNSPDVPPGPPYDSCKNFVVLKVGSAPDAPFGGEFLHGLGYVDAANLGFDDLTNAGPTGNALRDAIVTASKNYYTSVDPLGNSDTFAEFKTNHGFSANPATPAAGEFVAQYANSGDLGFGRDMHCKKNGANVACYVTNYGFGYSNVFPGGGTDDHDDANAAGARTTVGASNEIATVAMEYAPIDNDPAGDRVVKFYVYKKDFPNAGDYNRSISANLDGRGERPVPQLCMICHGGQIPSQAGGIPAFGTAAQVKLGARFLPFDHRFFTFPSDPALSKANQETKIKNLNEQIVNAAPVAVASDPVREIVTGMYNNGASVTQIYNFAVPGWVAGASANAPNQEGFYKGVVADACRTCHIAQPYAQLQFNNSDKFINVSNAVSAGNKLMLGTVQQRVCGEYVMPHALRTHDIFWNIYWDVPEWGAPPTPMATQLQNFGDGIGGSTWKGGLCTSFISGLSASPSNFYQQTIQPIWNGKCVACHVVGGPAGFLPLTDGNSFGNLAGVIVAGDDSNTGSELMRRITSSGPEGRMPQGCIAPPTPPGPGQLPCLQQSDIDKIKAWIRNGAN